MSDDTTAEALDLEAIRCLVRVLDRDADRSNDYIPATIHALLDEVTGLRAALAEANAAIARARTKCERNFLVFGLSVLRSLDGPP
jgi:hypothetical protein